MKTKSKLWLSVGALALTLVVAGSSIGIVLSALSAKVQSGFTVSYTANNVTADIQGFYQYIKKDNSFDTVDMTADSGNTITFEENEPTGTSKSFSNIPVELNVVSQTSMSEIVETINNNPTLSSQVSLNTEKALVECNGAIMFAYVIKNTGDKTFKMNCQTQVDKNENIKIDYWIGNVSPYYLTALKDLILFIPADDIYSTSYQFVEALPEDYECITNLACVVLIRISLIDETKDAKLSGSFNFTLG